MRQILPWPSPEAGTARLTLGARLRHGLIFMAILCTAIALFLTVLDGRPVTKFIYSFAIGGSCWAITDGLRLLVTWGLERWRLRRGLPIANGHDAGFGWRGMVPLIVLGVLVGPPIGQAIADALTGNHSPRLWDLSARPTQITLAVSVLATLVSIVVLTSHERTATMRLRAEAAQREASESQLRLLQSQLEPHMLFNTLANLRVLISLDPPRAQAMLDRLIAFLRATLTASRVPLHPLADEFARVDDYLALMSVRMGPRLQVDIRLPAELKSVQVPPLLLQPLVENCIKHGLEPQVAGGRIEVSARRDGNDLTLTVRDTGTGLPSASAAGDSPTSGTRFGLAQVRERLQTLYGVAARFDIGPPDDAEGGTLATIRLPLGPA
jgi:LytS/YehU family sensor histidine kinase